MTESERIEVVPAVLTWARKRAGFSPTDAAKKIGISEATLERWETGDVLPTIKQLRKAGKAYRRPLAVLLLPRPPEDFDPIRDFRRGGEGGIRDEWSPSLRAELRRGLSQREVFLELLEIAPGSLPEPVELPRLTESIDVEEAARALSEALGVQAAQSWSTPYDALNAFTTAAERFGILVMHTRDVDFKEARGFSLSEWPFPVIALNGGDWPRPRLFSLLHELTHISINASALCDLHETKSARPTDEDRIEHYCNQVAAAILMPASILLDDPLVREKDAEHPWSLDELHDLSRRFGASSEALLLRLVTLRRASWELYWQRKPEFEHEYEESRAQQKERQRLLREEGKGGPSYYVVKARDLGHAYVASVIEAFRSRAITSLDVSDYLEIKYSQLAKLEKVLR